MAYLVAQANKTKVLDRVQPLLGLGDIADTSRHAGHFFGDTKLLPICWTEGNRKSGTREIERWSWHEKPDASAEKNNAVLSPVRRE
jgi:hypothetical protein